MNKHSRKEAKKCIEFYLKYIKSSEYKEFCKKQNEQDKKNHQEYVQQEVPQYKDRTDFFEESSITSIQIGDILSNDGVEKLLKKLYSLPKSLYKVNNRYKKPTCFNSYDYIHLQYYHYGYGMFAEIEFLKDKYIKSIEIVWTQINNYYAYFEYQFHFKQSFTDELRQQFIIDNIMNLNRKDFIEWYRVREPINTNFSWLEQMDSEYFSIICQHYITTLFYSEYGKNNKLLTLIYQTRAQEFNIDKLYLGDIGESFYNKKSNFVIIGDEERGYYLLAGNNRIPNFSMCHYIAHYGNELYYQLFGYRELKLFEREFSQFSSGRKRISFNNKMKSLLNKIQSLSDGEYRNERDFHKEFDEEWDFYISNQKSDFKDTYLVKGVKVKEIYEKNFSYLKLLTEMNYAKSNNFTAIIALVVSIVATIISVIGIFAQGCC